MDIYNSIPDELRAKILLYLSTPTSDIIREDVMRRYAMYPVPICPLVAWRNIYSRAVFAERDWGRIMTLIKQIGPVRISHGSKVRFITNNLQRYSNVHLFRGDHASDVESSDDDRSEDD